MDFGKSRVGGLVGAGDETLAPSYTLQVNGNDIDVGVMSLIEKVEFESTDGMADLFKLYAKNPDFKLSDSKIFAPGNEVAIWAGYGTNQSFLGRVRIYKNRPKFADNGFATFEAVGYTRDHEMTHHQPEKSTKQLAPRGKKKQKGGRRFKNVRFSDAVKERAKEYGFLTDVDESPDKPSDFIQKVGLTDYDFIQGLANLCGFMFWVDGDAKGKWTLHFKDPDKWDGGQDKKFKFEYNLADQTTLFSFEPELLTSEGPGRIRARTWDTKTGKMIEAEFDDEADHDTPDMVMDSLSPDPDEQKIDKPANSSTAIQIFIGDYSFSEVATKRFKNEADLIRWTRVWFKKNRQNHILSNGTTIGVETIMARQIHTLEGVGIVYSGDYWFSRVKHVLSGEHGYVLEFSGRKQVKPLANSGLLSGII